jgi:hypothetical protein
MSDASSKGPGLPMAASQVLDDEFLDIRCRILDIAAALDRIERGSGAGPTLADPRLADVRKAIEILQQDGFDRALDIQMLFSLPHERTV